MQGILPFSFNKIPYLTIENCGHLSFCFTAQSLYTYETYLGNLKGKISIQKIIHPKSMGFTLQLQNYIL